MKNNVDILEEVKKFKIKSYKGYVVGIERNNPFIPTYHKNISIQSFNKEDYKPKKISVETFRKERNKVYEELKSLLRKERQEVIKKYGGKIMSKEEIEKLAVEEFCLTIPLNSTYRKHINSVEMRDIEKDYKILCEFVKSNEEKLNNLDKENIYANPKVIDDCEIYGDDVAYLQTLVFCMDIYKIKEFSTKELIKMANVHVIHTHIVPIFEYNCIAVEDFLNEDLTFKGLVKKLNPFISKSC